ncbi:MAG: arginine--tRNA ligase [Clostridia bacterium]|nr:arginine--tRNA ligase [Clostridia bacterium]
MNEREIAAGLIAAADENIDIEVVLAGLETPPDRKLGDIAFPCFKLAKVLKKAPPLIAAQIMEKISENPLPPVIEKVIPAGGYLNFFLDRSAISKAVVDEISELGSAYGRSDEGAGKTVVVEFSSPNIAKPFHIGHLVSTALGHSIARIYDFLGYSTVRVNHLGDWGTQFGKLITAFRLWGDEETIMKDPINELLKIYVRFHEEAEKDPTLEDSARANFRALENGDQDITKLWKLFVDASLKEFNRMYDLLGVSFDSFAGESFYTDKMPEVVDIMREKGILEESEGAMVVRFDDESMPPCIILKSDGTTIYATRDIAAALYRKRHYDFYKNVYVVGTPQTLHFKQVFGTLKKMGFDWADDCTHVGFGYVRFPDKAMSTRHGDVVLLEDVLTEAIAKTKDIITQSPTSKDLDNTDAVAEKVGIGAVLYTFLKNSRERDIIFTWKDILDFEGESGPYVQYAYARGRSVLSKAEEAGIDHASGDAGLLTSDEEYTLVRMLAGFRDAVRDAAERFEPSIVTRYVTDLAQQFNKFYNTCAIMKAEDELRKARLRLTACTAECIKTALWLIGVDVVEKM